MVPVVAKLGTFLIGRKEAHERLSTPVASKRCGDSNDGIPRPGLLSATGWAGAEAARARTDAERTAVRVQFAVRDKKNVAHSVVTVPKR